ncbi:zinc finger, CCHC-type containing protein, partial [Tanacetum coccineum]
SMFEISGNNFNDWFHQLKLVLRVESKLFVIEQPISLASPTDSEYLRSGMRIMRKTVGELHAMLIEYEKGLPKKAETPQVMMIKGGKIQKSNKKSLKDKGKGKANGKGKDKQVYIPKPKNAKPSAKEHPDKDDTFHHCKEVGHCKRNCTTYLAELIKKKKQVGTASSSDKSVGSEVDLEDIQEDEIQQLLKSLATFLKRVDYEETFSPVADIRAIRILISIAAYYDYKIWQMDVKTAFLNGYLDEDIYMVQTLGELHWTTVKNILKYLRNTKDMFLVYGENPEAELRVDCYCNAGFEIDINDMKSLTGYVSF